MRLLGARLCGAALARVVAPAGHKRRLCTAAVAGAFGGNHSGKPGLDWMAQAELDAHAASSGRKLAGSTTEMAMGKLQHDLAAEKVGNAVALEDRLRSLIRKCDAHRGDRTLFNAIRKRALVARQELITQREAAGLAKDPQMNAEAVEAMFQIPGPM